MNLRIYSRLLLIAGGIFVFSIIAAFSSMSQQPVSPEVIEGRAPVREDSVSRARAKALEDAFRKKLKQEVARMLPASVLEGDSAELETEIYSKKREFISRYIIANEYRDDDEYVVEAEVFVSGEAIRNALISKGFIKKKELGPIFLMVTQDREGKPSTWWESKPGEKGVPSVPEAVLAKTLKEHGYTLVEPIPAQPRPDIKKLISNPKSLETLGELTELFGASIYIQGNAKAVPVERKADTDTLVSEARLEVSLIDPRDQRLIARFSAQSHAEADTAANAGVVAVEQAARSTAPEILARLERFRPQAPALDKGKIKVSMSNLYSYKIYKHLEESIPGIPGVQDMELWGFSPGKVMFLVQYSGESLAFANSLAREEFGEFKLNILELDENRIQVQIAPVRYRGPRR
jgi:hypothetical protein